MAAKFFVKITLEVRLVGGQEFVAFGLGEESVGGLGGIFVFGFWSEWEGRGGGVWFAAQIFFAGDKEDALAGAEKDVTVAENGISELAGGEGWA